ncbi:MAG: hypothetical protein ACFFAA_06680 [Promethearchaeota archaeon]
MIYQTHNNIDKIEKISTSNCEVLENIIKKIEKKVKGIRKIMYSDVINLILREDYKGENYNKLILWCNYKIRLGKTYIEFE